MIMDMSQYLDVFLDEGKEHLTSLNKHLLELEKNCEDVALLNEIFRSAHTLKGMASTMGFDDLADLTHHMEDILSDLKEGKLAVNTSIVDLLFQCLDRLQQIIDNIETNQDAAMNNSDLITILEKVKQGDLNNSASVDELMSLQVTPNELGNLKSNQFIFNDYDIAVCREAMSKGNQIFSLSISVDENSLMKSVRVFMVFKLLEEEGDIIKCNPEAQELEEGNFDRNFQVIYISAKDKDQIVEKLSHISEVEIDYVDVIDPALLNNVLPNNEEPKKQDESENNGNFRKNHKSKHTVRVDIDRLDKLMNLVGELVMHKGRLEQIGSTGKISDLNETIEQIDRISSDLQSVVMQVRMVPIEQVFNRFPRMVRDLAKELNKEVDFIIEGKETELDRTVIDEIGDPLVHLLRNALDHGLESTEERRKNGKREQGSIFLRARHEGNNVYIEVEDDGCGINADKVFAKALEKGIISAAQRDSFTLNDAVSLLFSSGFSTAQDITDVSGRGVGLDVVKSKIESLNGEIMVESKPGKGTRFQIKLPLTLAIIQALMVAIGEEIYAIPLSSVDETTIIYPHEIKTIQKQEVMTMRGNVLPLFRLAELLEAEQSEKNSNELYIVVVRKADKQIGLIVDRLIGQQEIVIKSLGRILNGIPGIAGAIVAGDGNVRLIIDIATLF